MIARTQLFFEDALTKPHLMANKFCNLGIGCFSTNLPNFAAAFHMILGISSSDVSSFALCYTQAASEVMEDLVFESLWSLFSD